MKTEADMLDSENRSRESKRSGLRNETTHTYSRTDITNVIRSIKILSVPNLFCD